jgi:transcription-repair coupling factor (superfamily II helicase)
LVIYRNSISDFWKGIKERYQFLSHDSEHPLLEPSKLYVDEETIFSLLKPFPRVFLSSSLGDEENPYFELPPSVAVVRRNKDPIYDLKQYIRKSNNKVLLCADRPGRRESIKQLLEDSELSRSY